MAHYDSCQPGAGCPHDMADQKGIKDMLDIAVLSDIHGNHVALQKCLDYAFDKGISTFIFLGDLLGELAYPQKTMDLVYAVKERYRCFFIRGNKEEYWIAHEKDPNGWKEYDSTTGSLYHTYQALTEKDLMFFRSLPIKRQLEFDRLPPITLCHGSPRKVNEKLLPGREDTYRIMENDPCDHILCGHTHIQGKIVHDGKTVLNAGSVGMPLHSDGRAQFMILKEMDARWDYAFVSLEYDIESVIAELHSSGLSQKAPYWCKVSESSLRTGKISHGTVLARAMALCEERSGRCDWPNVPEECWKQAVNELIIPKFPFS